LLAYHLPHLPRDCRLSYKAYVGIFLGQVKPWNTPSAAGAGAKNCTRRLGSVLLPGAVGEKALAAPITLAPGR
jgi:hypothetical protein